jgi:hypothetical protein
MEEHPYYEPTNTFLERYRLQISEAEDWVTFQAEEEINRFTQRYIAYNKRTGELILTKATGWKKDDGSPVYSNLFDGFLMDEATLHSVIIWTRWDNVLPNNAPGSYR